MTKHLLTTFAFMLSIIWQTFAQSYTTTFPEADGNYPVLETVFWVVDLEENPWPAVDERHPALSDDFNQKVQTSDWWTSLTFKPSDFDSPDDDLQATRMYSHPLSEKTEPEGLGLDYAMAPTPDAEGRSATITHYNELIVGMENLNSLDPKTYSYSDWYVTAELSDGSNTVLATYGHGNPFAYFTKSGSGDARIEVAAATYTAVSNSAEVAIIDVEGHKWAFFAPDGSTWTKSGDVYTSNLNGEDYWSVCLLPNVSEETTTSYPATTLETFRKHAYAFPTGSTSAYDYNQSTQTVTTTFTVTTELKESANSNVNNVLQALYPHQWGYSSTTLTSYTYESPRGEMKVRDANTFTTSNKFNGVLATLPNLGRFSDGYSKVELNAFVESKMSSTCPESETYNQGKYFTQFIQLAQISNLIGNTTARDYFVESVKTVLENWLTADADETDRLLWYNDEWDVLVGYPDGHYMASLLNDKHFHWGYFIDAACLVEQFNPGWADTWGDMVNLMIRDAASWDRNDTMFPYLRNFDAYAGHSWAGGSGSGGNNQESSSEGMNFHQAVIKWGELTGNTTIRDLGVYLFATENTSINEYWYDKNERTLPDGFATQYASRVYSTGIDSRTFWTYDDWDDPWIINILPITGGSLYLGTDTDYVNNHIDKYFELDSLSAPTSWADILWSYMALADPDRAIEQFNANSDYTVEFAESKAHTYHWLHNMRALGNVDNSVYATNTTTAIVFDNSGEKTYVAFNGSDVEKTVNFSDGFSMSVGAKETVTSRDNEGLDLEQSGENIALNKNAYASTELGADVATKVTDGDFTSAWSNVHSEEISWIYVDLEESVDLNFVSINWHWPNASDYEVQGSNDASNWTTLNTQSGLGGTYRTDFISISGTYRYVRLYLTQANTDYGYAIYEFQVYGGDGTSTTVPVTGISLSNSSISLAAGGTQTLSATISPSNATNKSVSWSSNNSSVATVSSSGLVNAIAAGSATITATSSDGGYTASCSVSVSASSSLPSPWVTSDIGSVSAEGSATYSESTFTIEGSGADIWGTADEFRYVYQNVSGDASITAQVLSLENTNNWAKAGVMIRESLDAGSIHAMTILASTQGTSFQRRTTTDATSSHTTVSSISAPYWVRMERIGDTFTAYYSADGSSWTTIGSQSISMSSDVYIGLVTTSHSDGVLCTSTISNVTVDTNSGSGISVSFTTPTNEATFNEGDDLYVNVDASADNSTISNVQLYLDGTLVRQEGISPYEWGADGQDDPAIQSMAAGTYTLMAIATDANGDSESASISITVNSVSTTIDVTGVSVSPTSVSLNIGETQGLTETVSPADASDNSVSWSSSNTSVATVSTSGLVSAVSAGTATITVTTTDGGLTATSTITVSSVSTGDNLKIEAEDYTDMSGIDTQATEDDGGGDNVGWIDTDDWMEYSVTIPTSGTYAVDYRVASLTNGGDLTMTAGESTDNLTFDATSDWQIWTTVSSSITLTAGTQTIRITSNNSGWNINWFELTLTEDAGSGACSVASSNGEYNLVVSNDSENPTVTFEPILSGAGDDLLLIYYSTDPNATFAGSSTEPNVAKQLTAAAGETLYVYYTYSITSGGEHSTYSSPNSFTVGSCSTLKSAKGITSVSANDVTAIQVYPNPASTVLNIKIENSNDYETIGIYSITGQLEKSIAINEMDNEIDISGLSNGLYLIKIEGEQTAFTKFIKK